jgi:hypothetical protein
MQGIHVRGGWGKEGHPRDGPSSVGQLLSHTLPTKVGRATPPPLISSCLPARMSFCSGVARSWHLMQTHIRSLARYFY